MTEYCRYCVNLNCGYAIDTMHFLCNEKGKYVNIYSHCNKFLYCGFNENMEEHKPREYKQRKDKTQDGEQLEMRSEEKGKG